MRNQVKILLLASVMLLAACTSMTYPPPALGTPESEVIARVGAPAGIYPDGKSHLLEYPQGPMGQYTFMARIGPDGRLLAWEQVLTTEKFATIKVGKANKNDVLRMIGRPAEKMWFPLSKLEAWSYRYKEGGVWNSMMHIHFDQAGIVRRMENGRDPMYDESERSGRGRR